MSLILIMARDYQQEGRTDGANGWTSRPPLTGGQAAWDAYVSGYSETYRPQENSNPGPPLMSQAEYDRREQELERARPTMSSEQYERMRPKTRKEPAILKPLGLGLLLAVFIWGIPGKDLIHAYGTGWIKPLFIGLPILFIVLANVFSKKVK